MRALPQPATREEAEPREHAWPTQELTEAADVRDEPPPPPHCSFKEHVLAPPPATMVQLEPTHARCSLMPQPSVGSQRSFPPPGTGMQAAPTQARCAEAEEEEWEEVKEEVFADECAEETDDAILHCAVHAGSAARLYTHGYCSTHSVSLEQNAAGLPAQRLPAHGPREAEQTEGSMQVRPWWSPAPQTLPLSQSSPRSMSPLPHCLRLTKEDDWVTEREEEEEEEEEEVEDDRGEEEAEEREEEAVDVWDDDEGADGAEERELPDVAEDETLEDGFDAEEGTGGIEEGFEAAEERVEEVAEEREEEAKDDLDDEGADGAEEREEARLHPLLHAGSEAVSYTHACCSVQSAPLSHHQSESFVQNPRSHMPSCTKHCVFTRHALPA